MKIAVIAANGRLGKAFVEEALKAGHTIRAGIRGENTLKLHPKLEVIQCDATDIENVRYLLNGQKAVVSAIGHVKGSAPDVQTKATEIIVRAMKERHITRFVDVTGTGVRFPGDHISVIDRVLNAAVKIADPLRVNDGVEHVKVLQESALDWTTIRVLKLQNVKPNPFKLTLNGPTKNYVGREEVAQAMRQVIEENSFIQQAPIISNRN